MNKINEHYHYLQCVYPLTKCSPSDFMQIPMSLPNLATPSESHLSITITTLWIHSSDSKWDPKQGSF